MNVLFIIEKKMFVCLNLSDQEYRCGYVRLFFRALVLGFVVFAFITFVTTVYSIDIVGIIGVYSLYLFKLIDTLQDKSLTSLSYFLRTRQFFFVAKFCFF